MATRKATFNDQEVQEHLDRLSKVLDALPLGKACVVGRVLLRAEIQRMQEPLSIRRELDTVSEFVAQVVLGRS